MKQYSLVVLLRLRVEEVQKIANINQLFFSHDSETIAREVSANHGRGILFILDGFDELPKPLQQKGFLLDLILGKFLPESTVLVTSRPSATGELLTSCCPLIQKHVEVCNENFGTVPKMERGSNFILQNLAPGRK